MDISLEQLRTAMPNASKSNCEKYLQHLNDTFSEFEINTKMRIAHFLAQLAWESGSLKYTEEIASGKAYEYRKDLGNVKEGDGVRFKGRGLIQITGRANYRQYLEFALGRKLEESEKKDEIDEFKHLLSEPKDAVRSAGWFWNKHKLNQKADNDEFTKITKIINGSTITRDKRLPCLRYAKIAMGLKKPENTKKQQNTYNTNSTNSQTKTANIEKSPSLLNPDNSINTSPLLVLDGNTQILESHQITTPHTTTIGNPLNNPSSHL